MGYCNTTILKPIDVAQILGVSKFVVYDLIHEGRLKATDISNGNKKARFELREDDVYEFKKHYKKNSKRNIPEVKEKTKVKTRPKAMLKKKYTKEETKTELGLLKEQLLEILVKIEELENNID